MDNLADAQSLTILEQEQIEIKARRKQVHEEKRRVKRERIKAKKDAGLEVTESSGSSSSEDEENPEDQELMNKEPMLAADGGGVATENNAHDDPSQPMIEQPTVTDSQVGTSSGFLPDLTPSEVVQIQKDIEEKQRIEFGMIGEIPLPPPYEEGEEILDGTQRPTACPRRMSELKMKQKIKPIPDASSFFIFTPTNKHDYLP